MDKNIYNKHIYSPVLLGIRHGPPRADYRGLYYILKQNEYDIKYFFAFCNESKTD